MNHPYQNRAHQVIHQVPNHVPVGYEVRGPVIQQRGNPSESAVAGHYYQSINMPNPHVNNINVAHHNQLFQQYSNVSNHPQHQQPPQPQNIPSQFPPPHPQNPSTALIPPPQLRQQRDQDDMIDAAKGPNMIGQSNEQQNEVDVRDIIWGSEEQANVFWEQKFFLIYEKFEWFGSRFEMLKSEYISLSEQLLTVDSEEDWNELKSHHEQFAQKLQQMFQQLIAVADQNQQLINQRLEQDDGVWQRRYHQLLSNFKALQQKTSMLQLQNQEIKTQQQQHLSSQQQGNYPQLLSHYRNLQQEYQKLYNAYNKLQEQYEVVKSSQGNASGPSMEDFENMRMEYQRTLEAIHGENDQLKTDCQGFYEENQQLKVQLQLQSQTFSETEQLTRKLQQKEQRSIELSKQISEWKGNYEQLQQQMNQLAQRESSILKQSSKTKQIISQLQNQLVALKKQLSTKQSQQLTLSKRLQDQLKAKEHLIHSHQQQLFKATQLQAEKHLRQKEILEKQLSTLNQQYEQLLKQYGERDLSKYQLQAQERRLILVKEENQNLIEEIRVKNFQLAALRNLSLQVATYENVLDQYKALEKEKLALEQTSRKEHSELLLIKKKLIQTQHQFAQFKALSTSLKPSSQLKHLEHELVHQQDLVLKLQSENSKLQQLLASKEEYVRDLEEESVRQEGKLGHLARVVELMKEECDGKVNLMEKKIETLERRNKVSELEFRQEIVENFESEIKQLRQSNEDKLKKIKKLQTQLRQLTTRSTHLQRYSTSHNSELHLLQTKLTTLDSTNSDLLSKLTLARQSISILEQQLSSLKEKEVSLKTQLNSFTVQIQQADSLIKKKNQVIKEFQSQVQEFVQKVAMLEGRVEAERKEKIQKVKKCNDQIQKLKDRLYGGNSTGNNESRGESLGNHRYSSSYANRYLTFGPKQPQRNEQITKIQTFIIEQMNEENSKLRQEILQLNKKVNSLETLSRVVANNLEQSPTKSQNARSKISIKDHNKSQNQPAEKDVGYFEERLMKFNERLENCIQENQLIAVRDVDLTASQRIANHERERREMEIAYEKEIKSLKDQISSLSQQLASFTQSASAQGNLIDSDIKEFAKYDIMFQQAQKSTEQQVQFLSSKLIQQQKTNSALIKLNSQLKQQLQQSLQKSSQSTIEYYKLQWKEAEKSLQEQKLKSRKLSEENKRLAKQNLEHDTKLMKQYELKVFNIELQLKELQRENSYFRLLKNRADNQKANLLHDVNVYSADIHTIKTSTESKLHQYEKINIELREKCHLLQQQLNQATHSFTHQNDSPTHHNSNSKLLHVSSTENLRLSGTGNRRLAV